jgi:hypothetical protein
MTFCPATACGLFSFKNIIASSNIHTFYRLYPRRSAILWHGKSCEHPRPSVRFCKALLLFVNNSIYRSVSNSLPERLPVESWTGFSSFQLIIIGCIHHVIAWYCKNISQESNCRQLQFVRCRL